MRKYVVECSGSFGGATEFSANYSGVKYGVELEQFAVNRGNLSMVPLIYVASGLAKPELSSCQFEVASSPHESLRVMQRELSSVIYHLQHLVEGFQALPLAYVGDYAALGSAREVVKVTNSRYMPEASGRYRLLVELFGRRFVEDATRVASDQVNVGAGSEEDAFRVYNSLIGYLPIIAGISVASPFNEKGEFIRSRIDFNPQSQRLLAYIRAVSGAVGRELGFEDLLPNEMDSLEEYVRSVERLQHPHPNALYHFMRPMPHRGVAAEIRVIDKQPTLADTMAMTAFVKGLVSSGTTRETTRGELAEQLKEAAYHGIYDTGLFREALVTAEKALPEEERYLMRPLEERLENGTPAELLQRAALERSPDFAMDCLISSFRSCEVPFSTAIEQRKNAANLYAGWK
ncbi:hypothetical protein HY640_00130 [Candidatus Woesearchaeota archaeon]|nr:hypothetical protein [Candidatus Woesearchaeota archaeon]